MKAYQRIIANAPPLESKAYGNIYTLKTPVDAECWNHINGSITTLPAGCRLKVEHPNDATRTTCMMQDIPKGFVCSNGQIGYRFIINNLKLAEAIGEPIPEKTYDLIGAIIEAES